MSGNSISDAPNKSFYHKSILSYISSSKSDKRSDDNSKQIIAKYLALSYSIAETSVKSFFKLYDMVENSNDKVLKKEAKKQFSKTVIQLAKLFHELEQLRREIDNEKK